MSVSNDLERYTFHVVNDGSRELLPKMLVTQPSTINEKGVDSRKIRYHHHTYHTIQHR
jgi:hypothetical protein